MNHGSYAPANYYDCGTARWSIFGGVESDVTDTCVAYHHVSFECECYNGSMVDERIRFS